MCGQPDPVYRCRDCHVHRMVCQECLLDRHSDEPLHVIEVGIRIIYEVRRLTTPCLQVWALNQFQRTSLSTLGLRMQLGHAPCTRCPLAHPANKDFIVMHHNGVHHVSLDFCGCNPEHEPFQQLLAISWYPATPIEPKTCATFTVLRLFHISNLQAKVTAYDFYKSLIHLTDATGLRRLPVCPI
jgi:hypothetical protein